jgi:tRNA pseudouridine55 synthase
MDKSLNGILLVDKPYKESSFYQITKLRKKLGIKKIGHCGTLDPLATGLLVLCINKATKISDYLLLQDKEYIGEIKFGYSTTTDDKEGEILKQSNIQISRGDLDCVLDKFEGKINQIPPKFSAIKINGKKAYEMARKNIDIKISPREVNINKIKLIKFDKKEQIAKIHINCSKGTYIRSLARDIGEQLGCYAHLHSLRRIRSGHFSITTGKYDFIRNIDSEKKVTILDSIIPISQSLDNLRFLRMLRESENKVSFGQKLSNKDIDWNNSEIKSYKNLTRDKKYKLYDHYSNTIAIIDHILRYDKVLI